MKFSVLMSIYHKENPKFFDRAMRSIWDEQTIKPNEIILVQDGPLTDELYKAIDKWQKRLRNIFKTLQLEKNQGLGDALNIGLQNCSYDLVARMDTDDIALPNRFEKQLNIFKNKDIDICSSWVSEFDNYENNILSIRKVPETHNEILKYAKKRNPINHPAVMYKKEKVLKAGGYQHMLWFEDYYLWIRMMVKGAKFYNLQEPLVKMRAGFSQLQRRRGLKYAIEEYKFFKKIKKAGFINNIELMQNVLIRFPTRVLPKTFTETIYKKIRT